MEIFTSMTFWIIVIAIIVVLAIIGYIAEGTIKASVKDKKEIKKDENTVWSKGTPTEEQLKQETVYNVENGNWLDMPDLGAQDTVSASTLHPTNSVSVEQPVQTQNQVNLQATNQTPVENVVPQPVPVVESAPAPVQMPTTPVQNTSAQPMQNTQVTPASVVDSAPEIIPIEPVQNNQTDNNIWTN